MYRNEQERKWIKWENKRKKSQNSFKEFLPKHVIFALRIRQNTHKTNFNIIIMQNVWITLSQHAILRLYISSISFFSVSNIIGDQQCIVTADKLGLVKGGEDFVFYIHGSALLLKIKPFRSILLPNWCMHMCSMQCAIRFIFLLRFMSKMGNRFTIHNEKKKKNKYVINIRFLLFKKTIDSFVG